jgi:hypothetical protein
MAGKNGSFGVGAGCALRTDVQRSYAWPRMWQLESLD